MTALEMRRHCGMLRMSRDLFLLMPLHTLGAGIWILLLVLMTLGLSSWDHPNQHTILVHIFTMQFALVFLGRIHKSPWARAQLTLPIPSWRVAEVAILVASLPAIVNLTAMAAMKLLAPVADLSVPLFVACQLAAVGLPCLVFALWFRWREGTLLFMAQEATKILMPILGIVLGFYLLYRGARLWLVPLLFSCPFLIEPTKRLVRTMVQVPAETASMRWTSSRVISHPRGPLLTTVLLAGLLFMFLLPLYQTFFMLWFALPMLVMFAVNLPFPVSTLRMHLSLPVKAAGIVWYALWPLFMAYVILGATAAWRFQETLNLPAVWTVAFFSCLFGLILWNSNVVYFGRVVGFIIGSCLGMIFLVCVITAALVSWDTLSNKFRDIPSASMHTAVGITAVAAVSIIVNLLMLYRRLVQRRISMSPTELWALPIWDLRRSSAGHE